MVEARDLISSAFEKLSEKEGFVPRADQQHLAYLVSDCIDEKSTGVFEAPTGLGKSLAALVPALAHAIANEKRIVIATFTNVLAEQYWLHELPLARSLFESSARTEFLIGRQRYACLASINETHPRLRSEFVAKAELGIETEFRRIVKKTPRELTKVWDDISAPVVCPSRLCPFFDDCVYYRARRSAERAKVIITNHSVIMQDALLRQVTNGRQSLLGDIDFVVIDEAHDFPHAARAALDFELSESSLAGIIGLINRMEQLIIPTAAEFGAMNKWGETCEQAREGLRLAQSKLQHLGLGVRRGGILTASPNELLAAETVRSAIVTQEIAPFQAITNDVSSAISRLLNATKSVVKGFDGDQSQDDNSVDSIANYVSYISEFGQSCGQLFALQGVAVSHIERHPRGSAARSECVDISAPLRELLWSQVPSVSMSATLAIDREFEWYKRASGVDAKHSEILNAPFDYRSQTALYLPAAGRIPDPTYSRSEGNLAGYYSAIASEVDCIIKAVGGRSLVLFHSREEMEQVHALMSPSEEFPIFMQRRTGTGFVGERFKKHLNSSLFGLRSFWTGFDAPGETLSCVCLVRIPFEVPTDAASIVRYAWIRTQGLDPFVVHSLPQSKMMMRQGAGRLIRRDADKGIIAILDPRIRTKRYGSEILENLPPGIRTYDDIFEAAAHVGLDSPT